MEEGRPTITREPDVGTPNLDPLQAGPSIAGPPEAGRVEAGHLDAGPIENGPTEAGPAEAGTSSIAPKNNQILDCPVCYSLYDHETHVPKVLRCGHTVCLECLRQIRAMRQNVLRCPSCRRDHAFDDPVEVLPNNFAVLRVLDALCVQCKQHICVDEHLKICKTCLPNFIQKTTRELNESVQKFDDAIVKLSCDFDKDRQAELILDKQNSLENVCKELFKAYRDLLHIREREIIDQIKSASETDLKEIDKFHATLRLDIASITTKLDELKIGLSTAGSITDGIQTKHLLSLSSEIQEVLGKAKAWPESTIQDSRVHLCERFLHYIEKYTDISSPCGLCSDRHMMNSICHISNERMWYGNASVLQHFDNDTFGHEVFDEPLDVAVSPVDGTLIVVNNRSRRLVFFDQIDYDEGAYSTKHQYQFSKVVEDFGEEGSQFTGVDFNNEGNICLTDNQHNCIWIYKTNGDRVNRLDATGQFHDPAGIAVDPDLLWIQATCMLLTWRRFKCYHRMA